MVALSCADLTVLCFNVYAGQIRTTIVLPHPAADLVQDALLELILFPEHGKGMLMKYTNANTGTDMMISTPTLLPIQ